LLRRAEQSTGQASAYFLYFLYFTKFYKEDRENKGKIKNKKA
jgi:hypothetical protein